MKKPLLYSIVMSLLALGALQAQVPGYVPNTNLISWWGFNGNANDAMANNNLTNNGAVLTADRNSVANSAYQFDGINQHLLASSPSFTFGQSDNFTVSYWMQRATTAYSVAIMHGSGTNGNFIWNFQTGSTGNFQFGTNKQGSAWTWATNTYSPLIWEHFVGTYANGTMTLYKNGVQVTTATNSNTAVNQATLPLYVGRGIGGGATHFEGKLDDIGIWDRLLTPAEITALYLGCGTISAQPIDTTTSVAANASFGVSTSLAGSTYQWQIKNGSTFQDLNNGGQYSGVNTNTLTVSNIVLSNNGERFRCFITNGPGCSDTSNSAALIICNSITQQPVNVIAAAGSSTQFSVSYSDPTANYQWEIDAGSGFGSIANGGNYSGATTSTLTVSGLSITNTGEKFRCVIDTGACMQTSDEAELTVASVGLGEENYQGLVSLYPNPAKDILNIKVDPAYINSDYRILDLAGKQVAQGVLDMEETSFALGSYPAGYYILWIGEMKRSFIVQD